jgi:hypothetical protein
VVPVVTSLLVLPLVVPSSVAAVVIAVVAGPRVVLVPSAVVPSGPEAPSLVVSVEALLVDVALVEPPEPEPWSSEGRSLQLVLARPRSTPSTGLAATRCGASQNGQRVDASKT